MITLALDQASTVSGWSLWDNQELKAYGKFSSNSIQHFAVQLQELIKEHNPGRLGMEGIYATRNVATFKKLAQIQGVVLALYPEVEEVYPTEWKSSQEVHGKGRTEQKRNAQQKVLEVYGITATQDECDAILLGAHMTQQEINFE